MTFPAKIAAATLAFTFFVGSVASAGWFRDRSNSRNNHCCPSPCSTSYGHAGYGHGGYVTQQPYYSTGHSYGVNQVQHVATDCGCATATPTTTYYRGDSNQQSQGEWSEGQPTEAAMQPNDGQGNWDESERNAAAANNQQRANSQSQSNNRIDNRTNSNTNDGAVNRNNNSQDRSVEDSVDDNVDAASDAAQQAGDSDNTEIDF